MKLALLTAVLLAAAGLASAAPTPTPVALFGGPDNYTASFGTTHFSAGSFVDEFLIDFDGPALVNGQLSAIFQPTQKAKNQIVFTDVEVDGVDFVLDSASVPELLVINYALWAPTVVDGGFLLRVEGCAGACNGQPQSRVVAASYSGTLNLQRLPQEPGNPPVPPVQQVPEPASLALVLAALGGASLARRRRGLQDSD